MKKITWSGSLCFRRLPKSSPWGFMIAAQLTSTIDCGNGLATTVRIQPGLYTDGASQGKLLRSLMGCPFTGKYVSAAVVHDALYASHTCSRKEADQIFKVLMLDEDVSVIGANLRYAAVRTFGKAAWDGHDAEENRRVSKIVSCYTYKVNPNEQS